MSECARDEEWTRGDKKRSGPLLDERREGYVDVALGAGPEERHAADGARRGLWVSLVSDAAHGLRINEHGDHSRLGHQLLQQSELLQCRAPPTGWSRP